MESQSGAAAFGLPSLAITDSPGEILLLLPLPDADVSALVGILFLLAYQTGLPICVANTIRELFANREVRGFGSSRGVVIVLVVQIFFGGTCPHIIMA